MDWYYAKNSQKHGPVDQDVIQEMWDNEEIDLETLVWHEGLDQWQPLRSMGDKIDLTTKTPDIPTIPESGPFVATPGYFIRRGLAWIVDFMIFMTISTSLAIFLFGKFHKDGEEFLKDYMASPVPQVAPADSNPDNPASQPTMTDIIEASKIKTDQLRKNYPDYINWQLGIAFALWAIGDTLLIVYFGGSVGKLVTGLRVVDQDLFPVNFYKAFSKSITQSLLANALMLVPLTVIMVFATKENRSLSDMFPRTRVLPKDLIKSPEDRPKEAV